MIYCLHLHADGNTVDVTFLDRSSIEVPICDIMRLSEGATIKDQSLHEN